MYNAIKYVSQLRVPIYITENGIADAKDDRRERWILEYLAAVRLALKTYDVRGFFYWSLLDNFEWAEGYDMKFGLYSVNFETQTRTLRKGSLAYRDIIKRSAI